jgi:cytochrome c oxidase subunit 3
MAATSTIDGIPLRAIPVDGRAHRATGWWGMILFILTEAALFAYLLLSYYYVGAQNPTWPPTGAPKLELAIPNTIILLVSSLPMWWGVRAISRDRSTTLLGWGVIVVLLGLAFLIIEAIEWSRQPFGPATNAYGSLYFTVTGFHYAHVVVGLLMLLHVLWRTALGDFRGGRHLPVQAVAAYWHFVGLVWVFVFFTIYVSPHLW